MNVTPTPTLTLSQTATNICNGGQPVVITATPSLAAGASYSWTSNAPAITWSANGTSLTFNPAPSNAYTLAAGTYTFTCLYSVPCGLGTSQVTATTAVEVIANPFATNPLPAQCAWIGQEPNDEPLVLANYCIPGGGTWSGPGVAGGSLFYPNANVPHNVPLTLTYTTTCGTAYTTVTVYDYSFSPQINPLPAVCAADAEGFSLLPYVVTPGGIWSGTGVQSGLFYPAVAGAGTHTLTYAVQTPCSTSPTIVTRTITVNAAMVNPSGIQICCDHPYQVRQPSAYGSSLFTTAEFGNASGLVTIDAANRPNQLVVFDGIYRFRGRIRLTGGTFMLTPGTAIYFDRTAISNTSLSSQSPCNLYGLSGFVNSHDMKFLNYLIVDGQATTLKLEGATLAATCDYMWGGVFVTNGASIETKAYQSDAIGAAPMYSNILDAVNGVVISDNFRSTYCNPQPHTSNYSFTRTNFTNCTVGIWDRGASQVGGRKVEKCRFTSESTHFKIPRVATPGQFSTYYVTETGIFLNDYAKTSDYYGRSFKENTFDNISKTAINASGENVAIKDNTFTRCHRTGISSTGYDCLIEGNTMTLPNITPLVAGNGYIIGINVTNEGTVRNNDLTCTYALTSGTREQLGINVSTDYGYFGITGNTIRRATNGVAITPLNVASHISVINNNLVANFAGVKVNEGSLPAGGSQILSVRCNTFDKGVGQSPAYYGILFGNNARISALGSSTTANGNLFVNFGTSGPTYRVRSVDNSTIVKYFYCGGSTSPEFIASNSGTTPPILNGIDVSTCLAADVCLNQTHGMHRLSDTLTYAGILEMMDSVSANVGSADDMRFYLHYISKYHLKHNLIADLDAYVATQPAHNLMAYTGLGSLLMEHYRGTGQEAQAQTWLAGLLMHNPGDAEVYYRCRFFDVTGRVGRVGRPGSAPDSTDTAILAAIAGLRKPVCPRCLPFAAVL